MNDKYTDLYIIISFSVVGETIDSAPLFKVRHSTNYTGTGEVKVMATIIAIQ